MSFDRTEHGSRYPEINELLALRDALLHLFRRDRPRVQRVIGKPRKRFDRTPTESLENLIEIIWIHIGLAVLVWGTWHAFSIMGGFFDPPQ